jgi:RNA polymerase sigma-70 factor, ECF subfamily
VSSDPSEAVALEQAVARALEAGRAEWGDVFLDLDAFTGHVRRLQLDRAALDQHGADLVLALACAGGDERALVVLQRRLMPSFDPDLRRLGVAAEDLDDVRQLVLVRLLTSPGGGLASYAGRSSLLSWLRTVVCRTAIDVRRAAPRDPVSATQNALDRLVSESADPELTAIRSGLHTEFQQALTDSVTALTARSKEVLRLYYVDGMNIGAIGEIYGVHRATVARWINGIRSAVMTRLRQRVAGSLRPTSSEFRSLTEAVRDDLHLSVDRVLKDNAEG